MSFESGSEQKECFFAGSDEGAENWAKLASLIETCKLHGVNPEAYLSDVLTKRPSSSITGPTADP